MDQNALALSRLALARQENAEYLTEITKLKEEINDEKERINRVSVERDESVDALLRTEQ
jgi:hypothetical protein